MNRKPVISENRMNSQKNLFLICGDEEFLKQQKRNEMLAAFNCEGSMNYNAFSEDGIDIDEIRELIHTEPFMEEQRKLLISESGFFKANAGQESAEVFEDVPDSCIVIFYEKDADKGSRLYDLIRKKGEIFRFETADSMSGREKNAGKTEIRNWAKGVIRNAGRRIDSRTLFELAETAGYDLQNLSTELEKLICYTLERPDGSLITAEDVSAVCSKTLSDRIFEMMDHKFRGHVSEALAVLEELYALRISPMRILYFMVRQYNQALSYKECTAQRLSDAQTVSVLGIKEWQLDKLKTRLGAVTAEEIRYRLELCADAEYRVKTGDMREKLAVELLLIR